MAVISLLSTLAKLLWSLAQLLWRLLRLLGLVTGILVRISLVPVTIASFYRARRLSGSTPVRIRRDWNDHRIGTVKWSELRSPRWDNISGGEQNRTPQPFIHGFVWCDQVKGDIAHSCIHGPPPHDIKVCLVEMDNSKAVWSKLLELAGPKPDMRRIRSG